MDLKIRNATKEDFTKIKIIAKQVHDLHAELRPDIMNI